MVRCLLYGLHLLRLRDIELVDIKGNKIYCRLTGAASQSDAADQTFKLLVEQQLKEQVDDRLQVIAV